MGHSQNDFDMDCTSCVNRARKGLESEDYDSVAQHLGMFLELKRQLGTKFSARRGGNEVTAAVEAAIMSESESNSQLFVSEQQLEGTIRRKLAAAVNARDDASVLRILKAVSVLDFQENGLQILVDHLREVMALESQEDLEIVTELVAQGVGGTIDFATVLGQLFGRVKRSIDDNMKLLCNISGQDAVFYAIQELHRECDLLGPVILEKFSELRELSKLEKEIAGWRKHVASTENAEKLDPEDVAHILDEVQSLLRVGEGSLEYTVIMVEEARLAGARLSREDVRAFKAGPFGQAVQELSGIYVILEEFTLKENVRKAIERNKLELGRYEPEGLTSSMVDDILPALRSELDAACRGGRSPSYTASRRTIAMAVYFKFKGAKDFDSMALEGHFIYAGNLKDKIVEQK